MFNRNVKHKGFSCKILEDKDDKVYICRDNGADFEYGWVDKSEIEGLNNKEQEMIQKILDHRKTEHYKNFSEWSPEHREGEFAQGLLSELEMNSLFGKFSELSEEEIEQWGKNDKKNKQKVLTEYMATLGGLILLFKTMNLRSEIFTKEAYKLFDNKMDQLKSITTYDERNEILIRLIEEKLKNLKYVCR